MFEMKRAWAALSGPLGLPADVIKDRINGTRLRHDFEVGAIAPQDFYRQVMSLFSDEPLLSQREFARLWSDIFWVNQPMVDALKRIKTQVPIALLSNTESFHFGYIERHYPEIIALFEGRVVTSFEAKAAKPGPAIYQRALDVIGLSADPGSCLFVDDMPEFVAGARAVGLRAFAYGNHDVYLADMREAGLDI